uniref:Uncharacterized protein n=1 Tax=Esox lucius TaxID=8010 RepID=A0AAY5KAE8_ESOLU
LLYPFCVQSSVYQLPNIPGILVNGNAQDQNRYKPICQYFNDNYRFATLYDTTNRIPVFSAYKFTGDVKVGKRPPWMIEPQVGLLLSGNSTMQQIFVQAGNRDYINSIEDKGVNRGHLFPCCHAADTDTMNSTFTLTNIVPQAKTFNGGSWNTMECKVKGFLQDYCVDNNNMTQAYVVTRALPSENNKLNYRVNIPSVMWTAFCCYNSKNSTWISKAHWGENKNTSEGDLPEKTLGELYDMLNSFYQTDV